MPQPIPANSTASALGGLWFIFEHEGHKFAVWVSSLSGKEEVFLDGRLIAKRRKISLTSTHLVQVDAHVYTIKLTVVSLKGGIFQATLERSGEVLQGWTSRYVTKKSVATSVGPIAILGALAIALLNDSSPWYMIYLIALLAFGLLAWSTRGKGYGFVVEPIIEVAA